MADNNYKGSIDEVKLSIDELNKRLIETDKQLISISNNAAKAFTSANAIKSPQQLNKTLEQQEKIIEKLNEKIDKQISLRQSLNKRTAEEIINQRALAKAANLEATANSKLVGAYARLNAQRAQAKTRLQNLTIEQGKNSRATRKAQREYDKLTKRVNQANRATSNFSKTSLGGLARGFRSLLGAFGITGALYLFADFTKQAFRMAKELDSLRLTMNTLIKDETELAITQAYINDLTERYGTELISTTQSYVKFRTATRASGLSLEQTQKIFEGVTKSTAVLGLSTEKTRLVYLALEQMISKGKISTEELRRQLGESLPVAMEAMARAVGVSVGELDKLLKKGEVISKEVMPRFAEELEKALGTESITKVDTLNSSVNRLSNAWTSFIDNLTKSDSAFTKIASGGLGILTDALEAWTWVFSDFEERNKKIFNDSNLQGYKKGIDDINSAFEWMKKNHEDTSKAEENYLKKGIDQYKEWIEQAEIAINFEKTKRDLLAEQTSSGNRDWDQQQQLDQREEAIIQQTKELGLMKGYLKALEERINGQNKLNKTEEEGNDVVKKKLDSGKLEIEQLGFTTTQVDKYRESLQKALAEKVKELLLTEEGTDKYNKLAKVIKIYQQALDGLGENDGSILKVRTQTESLIEAMKDTLDYIPKNSKRYRELKESIEMYQQALDGVPPDLEAGKKHMEEFSDTIDKNDERLRKLRNTTDDFLKSFTDGFFSEYGFEELQDLFDGTFSMLMAGATNSREEFAIEFNMMANIAKDAFALINQYGQENFEAQYIRLERQKEVALQFAGESATAQAEIERQYEQRRREIARREARAQKEQALFNIAINTASAVVSALPNIPLSIVIGALGAAQAAVVASQTIPEYYKGTMNSEGGLAWTQEKGAEIITDRNDKIKTFGSDKGATLTKMDKGDKVYTASKTRSIIGQMEQNMYYNQMSSLNDLLAGLNIKMNDNQKLEQEMVENNRLLRNIAKKRTSVNVKVGSGRQRPERANGKGKRV